jgi:hypothetical protein
LDESHPKLNLVNHEDYIPREFLPTFSSNVLELHLHRIPGLAERFVYFNDDCFIIRPLSVERFYREGLPSDIATFKPNVGMGLWYKMLKNNVRVINEYFDKKEVMRRDHDKWFYPEFGSRARWNYLLWWYPKFTTLRTPHNAQPYIMETYREVWDTVGDRLIALSANRFRTENDHTQELFRTWQICRGNFMPYNTYRDTKMFPLVIKPKQAIEAVRNQSYTLVCLNDNAHIRNYERVMQELGDAFESILSEKSGFEK